MPAEADAIKEAVNEALRLLGDERFRPLCEVAVQSFAPWVERWGPAETGRVLAERVRRLHQIPLGGNVDDGGRTP